MRIRKRIVRLTEDNRSFPWIQGPSAFILLSIVADNSISCCLASVERRHKRGGAERIIIEYFDKQGTGTRIHYNDNVDCTLRRVMFSAHRCRPPARTRASLA